MDSAGLGGRGCGVTVGLGASCAGAAGSLELGMSVLARVCVCVRA